MQLHSNATTNQKIRRLIHEATGSQRSIAARFGVCATTVKRWKTRDTFEDRSSRPKKIDYNLSLEEQKIALSVREEGVSLDDAYEGLMSAMPHIVRSSLYRLWAREGLGKLKGPKREPSKTFKEYEPGYLHIDQHSLPALEGHKRYCFVAIDRATRLLHTQSKESKEAESGVAFLRSCLAFYPFKITKILTDNGPEFTNACFKRHGKGATKTHDFDTLCLKHGIEHRLTKPYTPKTNGLVERANGMIKAATIKKHRYDNSQLVDRGIQEYVRFFNGTRKHRKLGYKTPMQKVEEWYNKTPELFLRDPVQIAA